MKTNRYIFFLSWFVLTFWECQLLATNNHPKLYTLVGSPQFAHYQRIKESHLVQIPPLFYFEKFYATGTLGTTMVGNVLTPLGLALGGVVDILASEVDLLLKYEALNKKAYEYSLGKASPLLPYLGREGSELLLYYLLEDQKVLYHGQEMVIRVLDSNNKLKKKIDIFQMRDLIREFIVAFQKKGLYVNKDLIPAEGARYEEDIDKVLNAMGFVILSKETIDYFGGDEEKAYREMYNQSLLDKRGSLKKKKDPPNLPIFLLHDLGYVAKEDIELFLRDDFYEWSQSPHVSPLFKKALKGKEGCLFKELSVLTQTYFNQEDELERVVSTAAISCAVSSEQFENYKRKYNLHPQKGFSEDRLTLLKLAFIEENGDENYHYLKVEDDLSLFYKAFILELSHLHIHNHNFKIISFSKGDIVFSAIMHLNGIGMLVGGTMETVFPLLTGVLSPILFSVLNYVGFGIIGLAGIPYTIVHAIATARAVKDFVNVTRSSKVAAQLSDHLQKIKKERLDEANIKRLYIKRFEILIQRYMMTLQKKMLLSRIGLESCMMILGLWYVSVALYVLLAVLGVGFFVSTFSAFAVTAVIPAIYMLSTIPLIFLAFHDIGLQQRILMLDRLIEYDRPLFEKGADHFTERQLQFFDLFFKSSKNILYLGRQEMRLNEEKKWIWGSEDPEDILVHLGTASGARRKAISRLTRAMKEPGISEMVETMVGDRSLLKNLIPTYRIHKIDYVLKALNPESLEDPKDKINYVELPKTTDDFYQDVHLAHFFANAHHIYKDIRKNVYEYQFLLQKQRLQEHYFGRAITDDEWHTLEKHLKRRSLRMREPHYRERLIEERMMLHQLHPSIDNSQALWGDSFFKEYEALLNFDRQEIAELPHLPSIRYEDAPQLELPKVPSFDSLENLYLYQ